VSAKRKTFTVLVVDDEPELTQILVQFLDRQGYDAFGITGGAHVVQWTLNHHCDVVILDLFLRDAKGLSLIAPIRKASPKTRVIVMSGMHDSDLEASALREGASRYFRKPVDFDALSQALKSE
jgi:DNA-binding NtrC family response regulator